MKLTYKPENGPEWIRDFPEVQANKMLKRGRWRKAAEPVSANNFALERDSERDTEKKK